MKYFLFLLSITLSLSAFGGWDKLTIHPKVKETLVVGMGHFTQEGIIFTETIENGKPVFMMSSFIGEKPINPIVVKEKDYVNFYKTIQGQFLDMKKTEKNSELCINKLNIRQRISGEEKFTGFLCIDHLARADKKDISTWYRLARQHPGTPVTH